MITITVYQGSQADKELAEGITQEIVKLGGICMMSDRFRGDHESHFVVIGDERAALETAIEARSRNAIIHHLYAGDKSGCQDDYYRDAISALSDYLYAASASSYCRAVLMSSRMQDQVVTLCKHPIPEPDTTRWAEESPYAYVRFHPNTLEPDEPVDQWIDECVKRAGEDGIDLYFGTPNDDKGASHISGLWETRRQISKAGETICHACCLAVFPRAEYIGMLQHAQWIAGNSSSFVLDIAPGDRHKVKLYGNRQQNRVAPDAPANAPTFGEAILRHVGE